MKNEYIFKVRESVEGVRSFKRMEEIVRCKKCKWWDEKTCSSTLTPDNRLCLANRCYWRADDFCSKGERRENDEVN